MRPITLQKLISMLPVKNDELSCLNIVGFCVDSRGAHPNELFFALPGERVDGHNFLQEVASKGVLAAVVHESYHGPSFGLTLLRVLDVLEALQWLARDVQKLRATKVVGVTGSWGKTTTKGFIYTLLMQQFHVAASLGSRNSQIGLPLTLLNDVTGREEFLVQEMAMDEAGQIKKLTEIALPDVALLTSVGLVHACHFEGIYGIAMAKAEIFSHSKTKVGVICHDVPFRKEIVERAFCEVVSYSVEDPSADYFLWKEGGKLLIRDRQSTVNVLPQPPILGEHFIANFLAAVVVGRVLGMEWSILEQGICQLILPKQRFQEIKKRGVTFIDDSYNACATSVNAAISSLPLPAPGGKRVVVLGEMLELGKFSDRCHGEVGEHAIGLVDAFFCYGERCQPIVDLWQGRGLPAALYCKKEELMERLLREVKEGDVVLVKGSNANKMWTVIEAFERRKL